MRSLFLEPNICIIGLCEANSGESGKLPEINKSLLNLSLLQPALGVGVPELRGWEGSKDGAFVVRPAVVAHLAPLKDKPRAGDVVVQSGLFQGFCTHPSWRPGAFQGSPGSRTHRAVFHSVHQVPGLGWHVPTQGKRSWTLELRSKC